eukprot:TRINITY_DN531_c0_g3_i1.p1 TRINITY_DN531_c0_g3~~TRINITY_DN531_c0_g3_i1.p1  ORF type:complete len:238 (-),score=52.26 TRINITY_DN531_c0_g3_i1:50-718(-)
MSAVVIKAVEEFIERECLGRDETHGAAHMREVRDTAMQLFDASEDETFALLVETAALLHDVPDHKYDDEEGSLMARVQNFINSNEQLEPLFDEIIWIIDHVSYSKEVKDGGKSIEAANGTRKRRARDIVSDADKCAAIGSRGAWRCAEFRCAKAGVSLESVKADPTEWKRLCDDVNQHADEKLLLLATKFVRTEAGKKHAKPMHDELLETLINEFGYRVRSE